MPLSPTDQYSLATNARKAEFLAALENHLSIGPSAKAAGVARSTVYRWMDDDPDFKAAVNDAREQAVDVLEESAYERALKGDTVMSIFLLKGNRPDKYAERSLTTNQSIGVVRIEFDNAPPIIHALPEPQPMAAIGAPPIIDAD